VIVEVERLPDLA